MPDDSTIIGIDIGSVSVAVVEMNLNKEVLRTGYEFHRGQVEATLKRILSIPGVEKAGGIAATSATPSILRGARVYDTRIAIITAVGHAFEHFGSILLVGGEKFGLIRFDADGNYLNFKANTSCAAGTGSFLDQQARRLNLEGIGELSDIALANTGAIPKIASRCAVFAKTDLIHAQQEGFSLAEICDGLCFGLARNIVNTLFAGDPPLAPVVFAGGVARNRAVVRHIRSMIEPDLVTSEKSHLFGAMGAALALMDEPNRPDRIRINSVDDILVRKPFRRQYFYAPLELRLSDYPDFEQTPKQVFVAHRTKVPCPVEIDNYADLRPGVKHRVHLGIDIGSTSTKAVLLDRDRTVLAGFYTQTAGRPLDALQAILAAIDDLTTRQRLDLEIIGSGTTGSGRKFIGHLIGADMVVDEITAHARAAVLLNPEVDTIIEIGGQDSKFTTLRNGMVTSAIMNNVCAAGTGSFIEEQARKLGCPLADYAARTERRRSPMTSDRCTVFMERDINHYLNEGYCVDEALASVLHAICENYLTKVAIERNIGATVLFQGATAKNRSLVAAFEQRLEKPIHVSPYCHLTGAIGAALLLADQGVRVTTFKGINLHKKNIPLKTEVCSFCTNHCKITLADMDGEKVAYGFLCGRDYDTHARIDNNRSGFDLMKERKKSFAVKPVRKYREGPTIGIPAALHVYEDIALWRNFFDTLGIKSVTSEHYRKGVEEGKPMAAAEFCAPMAELYGHVNYLLDRSDYIFLPVYLEKKVKEKGIRRQFCYYTQFAAALASTIGDGRRADNYLMPLVYYLYNPLHTKARLYRMINSISTGSIGFSAVSSAYDKALAFKASSLLRLKNRFRIASRQAGDFYVVLLGRPYTVLSPAMNKGIPEIFAGWGIKAFYQDMLSYTREDVASVEPLLRELHWHYASQILAAAEVVARSERGYPVLITSFKCSPDSFLVDYFKTLMESHAKPYLVLQLDEHDSRVGYETRIEASIRAFKNHASASPVRRVAPGRRRPATALPEKTDRPAGKTLLLPNWDDLSLRLIVAGLRHEGVDARLLEENPEIIQKSLRYNSGQCIPLNIIAQEVIHYVEKHSLDPSQTLLWLGASTIACNIKMYPTHIKTILESYGKGMEKTGVYTGPMSLRDISLKMPITAYFAYMFGGYIRRIGCRLRPYENVKGQVDEAIEKSMGILTDAFLQGRSKEAALTEAVSYFRDIAVTPGDRPKVAVFGDLYSRDNTVMNQGLTRFIEANGGEVITTPYTAYTKMIAGPYLRKWLVEGCYLEAIFSAALIAGLKLLEKTYYKYFEPILGEPEPTYDDPPQKILSAYNIRIENIGETVENVLKLHYIKKYHPDVALFVQASPAFCCPSLVTEALARQIEKTTGVPIVSVTYDGTGGNKNEAVIPHLRYPRRYTH